MGTSWYQAKGDDWILEQTNESEECIGGTIVVLEDYTTARLVLECTYADENTPPGKTFCFTYKNDFPTVAHAIAFSEHFFSDGFMKAEWSLGFEQEGTMYEREQQRLN